MRKITVEAKREDGGERLDRFLSRAGGISRGEARRALERGGVWVDGRRIKVASRAVQAGQTVVVVLEEGGRSEPALAELPRDRVLYEDPHLIAVDKPPKVAAQPTLGGDRGTLLALVSDLIGAPAGLVHRLDFETSGVTVFAKSKPATTALAKAFREGTARKRYLAVSVGALPPEGLIDLPLAPDPRRKGRYLATSGQGLPACTEFRRVSAREGLCAVEVRPRTGRTHQIRVHLASQQAPILGDVLYGGPEEAPGSNYRPGRFLLHARELILPHPVSGALLAIQAPVPADLTRALELAGADASSL